MSQRSRASLQEHGTQATLVAMDSDPAEPSFKWPEISERS